MAAHTSAEDHVITVQRSFAAWLTIWASRIFVRPTLWLLPLHTLIGVLGYRFTQVVACRMWFAPMLPHTEVDTTEPRGRTLGEWVGGQAKPGGRLIYYIHGSGYISCSPWTHRGLVSELSRRLHRPVFAVRYRRAPKYRFPAAHDDVLNGYLWLIEQGHRPRDIVVMGDSAGGHLALGLCVQLRELGVEQPAALVGFSSLVDPTWQLAQAHNKLVWDQFASARTGRRITHTYLVGADISDSRLDVLGAVGPDLPPMLLQTGGSEILASDSEHYAAALRSVGGRCELEVWSGMFHVFQMGYPQMSEARSALDSVERFVESVDANSGAAA
ncbi:alpha/beta hydrolase [Nocardia cyriacigeorgica]|uniref:alpha/beta hydrolase n=1 Tax=Nocardia cyriacigeorgica TaxID=135487 RepID=UPI001894D47E|nr:alpha/beta hydrolase [Nocardia cyriacigeorgica]MBF6399223.1 alpha/beta hydrolase [Nocardia cyriacigeorgica]MBF6404854.1 alpha/beta hydrolase [Nocardia cyriacigeorgica]